MFVEKCLTIVGYFLREITNAGPVQLRYWISNEFSHSERIVVASHQPTAIRAIFKPEKCRDGTLFRLPRLSLLNEKSLSAFPFDFQFSAPAIICRFLLSTRAHDEAKSFVMRDVSGVESRLEGENHRLDSYLVIACFVKIEKDDFEGIFQLFEEVKQRKFLRRFIDWRHFYIFWCYLGLHGLLCVSCRSSLTLSLMSKSF